MSVDPDVYQLLQPPDVVYQTSAVDLVGSPKYPDHQQLQELVYFRQPSAEARNFPNLQWVSPYVSAPAPAAYEDEGYSEDVSGCPVLFEPSRKPYESARFADFGNSAVGVIVGNGATPTPVAYVPSHYYDREPLKTRKASAPVSCRGGRKASAPVSSGGGRKASAPVSCGGGRKPKGRTQKPAARSVKKVKDRRYTGSGGVVELSEEQRRAEAKRKASASVRERVRQVHLNAALDALRAVLPCCKPPGKKLTKIETLKLAIKYMTHLQILNSEPPGTGAVPVGNCDLDLCQSQMRAAAPNYYNCYKQDIDHPTSYYSHQVQIVPPSELYWQADDNQSFVYHGTTWNNV